MAQQLQHTLTPRSRLFGLLIGLISIAGGLAQGQPVRAPSSFDIPEGSIFVSHTFNPIAMRDARSIDIAYQSVIDPWIEARGEGTVRRFTMNADITLEPGILYEASISDTGLKVDTVIISQAGFYPAGRWIKTNATANTDISDARIIIEDATLDEAAFRDFLVRRRDLFSGEGTPLLSLGWERSWLNRVRDTSHPGHHAAVQEGVRALELAQTIWPEAAVSFYGCPWGTFTPSQEWEDEMAHALAPILDRVDWLGPSIYDKHRDDDASPAAVERQRNSNESAMNLACRVAAGRPILPWVRHRHFEVGAPYHNNLINKYEFKDHRQWAWNFNANREMIDGFVLWYRDRDLWEKHNLAPPEAGGPAVDSLLDDVEYRYHAWMRAVITES